MSTPVTIRPARVSDAPALARLRWEFRAPLGAPVEDELSFVKRCTEWMVHRLTAAERWRAWVAVRVDGTPDGAIIGTLWNFGSGADHGVSVPRHESGA